MCSRGKNIRVKENLENKRSKWKQTATIRKGWVAQKADRVGYQQGDGAARQLPGRACWWPGHQFHSAPLKLLRNSKN